MSVEKGQYKFMHGVLFFLLFFVLNFVSSVLGIVLCELCTWYYTLERLNFVCTLQEEEDEDEEEEEEVEI